jgi:hypothetical protein
MLTTLALRKLTHSGRYVDGGRSRLYLKVSTGGGRSWKFCYMRGTKTERDLSLAEAREKAHECRRMLLDNRAPLVKRRAKQQEAGAAWREPVRRGGEPTMESRSGWQGHLVRCLAAAPYSFVTRTLCG